VNGAEEPMEGATEGPQQDPPAEREGPVTVYEFVGGDPPFRALVEAFYRGVETDPLLRPMYPGDLTDAREHLFLFLIQFFGGPDRYDRLRGHPRLRLRHAPFRIGAAERDAWLRHMLAALDASDIPQPARTIMRNYFTSTAQFLVNRPE
jgi:hemoglobin